MKVKRILIPLLLCLGLFVSNQLQAKVPIKFGKVSEEELKMTQCAYDTTAPAVILCDYGEFNPNEFTFYRILRIKILNKEGLDMASQVFSGSNIQGLRGKTYNLVNGKIESEKLAKESIFKERVTDNRYRYRVAMPNVKVGSVFEISYTLSGLPDVWKFQWKVPALWSELSLPSSTYVDFRKNFSGYLRLKVSTQDHWIAENAPAFKDEPFISTSENFLSKMTIDILNVSIPGAFYKEYTTNWNAIAKLLNESEYFGLLLKNDSYLKDIEKEINARATTPLEKLKMAYDTIKMVKWNGIEAIVADHVNLKTCLNDLEGSSAEINLMLLNLLNRLDIPSHPIVLSTRDNGYLPQYFPSIEKLNYTIISAQIDDETYLIDASEKYLPLGMLPDRCINGYGQLIEEKTATQIKLDPKKISLSSSLMQLEINDDLSITGSFNESMSDYAAFDFREEYETFNSHDEFVKDMMAKESGLTIEDYTVMNLEDIYKPIITKMNVKFENQCYAIDDEIYINPLLMHQLTENPFKIEKRTYPIEFPHGFKHSYSINYKLPEGYQISELPKPQRVALPDKAGSFIYQVSQIGPNISVGCTFEISKTLFLPDEYDFIKQLYDIIVNKEAEPIILKKI